MNLCFCRVPLRGSFRCSKTRESPGRLCLNGAGSQHSLLGFGTGSEGMTWATWCHNESVGPRGFHPFWGVYAPKATLAAVAVLCLVVFIPATDFGNSKNSPLLHSIMIQGHHWCQASASASCFADVSPPRLEWLGQYSSLGLWSGGMGHVLGYHNTSVLLWFLGWKWPSVCPWML